MKILLIGSGGREHAFAWKLSQSPKCRELYIAPGNPGTASCGTNVDLDVLDFEGQAQLCSDKGIDLIVVGPEVPLVEGIYDFFLNHATLSHIPVVGPSKKGAQLEGSKSFAKEFMIRHSIPTAAYREFNDTTIEEGLQYLADQKPPIVLKADGLAAGKGVLICNTVKEAQDGFREMLGGKFGTAGARVVVEEFMTGIEYSVFVLTDGRNYKILPTAKDYKRIGEGDTGLNTGGMGAISPPPFVNESLMQETIEKVVIPSVRGLQTDDLTYCGFLYIGLMKTDIGPRVVEYNCRMGDPETQAVLPRIESDLVELLHAAGTGRLDDVDIVLSDQEAATVILASGGYPEAYEKGKVITGTKEVSDSIVFHAGTKMDDSGNLVTNGGRVLAITSLAPNWKDALAQSNKSAADIEFEGKYNRKDIGFDL